MVRQPSSTSWNRRRFIVLALALVAFYIIIPQIGSFQKTLPLLMQAKPEYVWLAISCATLTYALGAGTYCFLSLRRLAYGRTVVVQIAGMFVNRLLPAGIGSIGVNYSYMRKARHSRTQAASVVAVNNMLGIVGHLVLLGGLLVAYRQSLPALRLDQTPDAAVIAVITVAVLAVWALLYRLYGRRFLQTLRDFGIQLLSYRQRPGHLAMALVCSAMLTLVNVLALWFCVAAMGGNLSFMSVFLIFTFGVALGTATPTPGGLGGIEVGLITGLVVYQLDEATALAIVLLYRLLTYWLPLLVGSAAFAYSQRRHYF